MKRYGLTVLSCVLVAAVAFMTVHAATRGADPAPVELMDRPPAAPLSAEDARTLREDRPDRVRAVERRTAARDADRPAARARAAERRSAGRLPVRRERRAVTGPRSAPDPAPAPAPRPAAPAPAPAPPAGARDDDGAGDDAGEPVAEDDGEEVPGGAGDDDGAEVEADDDAPAPAAPPPAAPAPAPAPADDDAVESEEADDVVPEADDDD